jgi:tetratricopeptide (TPR) repeat protein
MLFELGGKRKRVIQVIYALLAILMAGGLVFFGIGSGTSGGLFDAIGIGGNGSSDPQYEQQIEKAEQTLATDPDNARALNQLARTNFLSAQSRIEIDENGIPTPTDEALAEYRAATNAWERYLKTNPKKPNQSTATLMVQAYGFVAGTDMSKFESDLEQVVRAAEIVAEANPSAGTEMQLARFAYLAGDEKTAKRAEQQALELAPDSATKRQIKNTLTQAKRQGKQIAEALKQSAPDKSVLQDPLGGLGGSAGGMPGG